MVERPDEVAPIRGEATPARDEAGRARDEAAPTRDDAARARGGAFARAALAVVAYAVAMAYLELACVVYLQRALALEPGLIFPLRDPGALGGLGAIEIGREAATLVMLGAVGWLAGRSPLERLAWVAVAFGAWDIAYYGWLFVFEGWPTSLETWDLLFLLPVPWAGPVWAPVAVSGALIGFGLAAARRARRSGTLRVRRSEVIAALAGGLVVILSFTANAGEVLAGGVPTVYPWPVFVLGMALAVWAAAASLLRSGPPRGPDRATRLA